MILGRRLGYEIETVSDCIEPIVATVDRLHTYGHNLHWALTISLSINGSEDRSEDQHSLPSHDLSDFESEPVKPVETNKASNIISVTLVINDLNYTFQYSNDTPVDTATLKLATEFCRLKANEFFSEKVPVTEDERKEALKLRCIDPIREALLERILSTQQQELTETD